MGAFDDAIREHLELKRRQGASEEAIKQQEEEALGRGPARFARPEATSEPAAEENGGGPEADAAPAPAEPPEEPPEAARAALAEPDEVALDTHQEPAPVPALDDELEPDEVLPAEALEPSLEEDVLEETPDFLEQSPDQDRLWFEQRRPKDFDFGD
jgi:hypothetical protein